MLKWYETKKPWKCETEWWTQRDCFGIYYSIKIFYNEDKKFHLSISDLTANNKAKTYETLIAAMEAAEAHFNSIHN